MRPLLFDTDIVSYFLKGHPVVRDFVASSISSDSPLTFSLITYYEILSGLMHRDAYSRLATFKAFANTCQILPLTPQSIIFSAELYADLRRQGTPVDDIDLLIAGVALEYNLTLVTNNLRHFGKIQRLTLHSLPLEQA